MAGVADAWRGAPRAGPRRRRTPPGPGRVRGGARGALRAGARPAADAAGTDGPGPTRCPGCRSRSGPRARRTRGTRARRRPSRRHALWALAERRAAARRATDREVTARWHAIYRRNRGVIGPDPDLILPGQVLRLTQEQRMSPPSDRHSDPRPGRLRPGHARARPEPAARAAGAARPRPSAAPSADVVADRPEPARPARAVGAPLRPGDRRDRRRRPARQPAAAVDVRPGLRRPAPPGARWWPAPAATSPASAGSSRSARTSRACTPASSARRSPRPAPGCATAPGRGPWRCGSRSAADRWLCTAMEFA